MRLNVPPIIPYVVGAMLVFFGLLRMKYLGAPRVPRAAEEPGQDDGQVADEAVPVRGKEQRRHQRMGMVWVLLGLFLLVSTYIQIRRH
jgi:predicted nucleic acid-binding Zn ribbon protein